MLRYSEILSILLLLAEAIWQYTRVHDNLQFVLYRYAGAESILQIIEYCQERLGLGIGSQQKNMFFSIHALSMKLRLQSISYIDL